MPKTKTKRNGHKLHRAPRAEFDDRKSYAQELIKARDGEITYREINAALAKKFENVRVMDPRVLASLFKEAGYTKHAGRRKGEAESRILEAQQREKEQGLTLRDDQEISSLSDVSASDDWGRVCHDVLRLMPRDHIEEAHFTLSKSGQVNLTVKQVVTRTIPV
jgi:hypothetical protein